MTLGSAAATVTVHTHVDQTTGLTHSLYRGSSPWVTLDVGDGLDRVVIFVRDLGVLSALAEVVEAARQDLAGELGLLPNGEPCEFVEVFGSLEWNEHDHERCLEQLVDEPVPFVPVVVSDPGTAWERHDDPTIEDNPLDDDDFGDESDEDDDFDMVERPGNRILRAEGWL
ncbi:hypothetical protein [Kribbella sp. NPDC049584]|uniref:hypothetical protein n=1 Tax=Kribbella sp. NPDC049584 TaxID=3154833 RepID=UPI0034187499